MTATQIASGVRIRQSTIAIIGLLAGGLVLWRMSLDAIPLRSMTDLGLGSVLPPGVWISFLLISVAFALALRAGRDLPILLTVGATVVVLHGLGIVAEPELRFAVSWQHLGIADYLLTHKSVDPSLDAYQNWPGFFAFTAYLREVTGLGDLAPLVKWAPVVYNLLYLGPIVSIGRSILGRSRVVWLAAWLFSVNNWIGQDYFSPQGLHLFTYLTILAVILRWFKRSPAESGTSNARASAPQRVVLVMAIFLMVAAVVSSHQLTPYALVLTTTALVVAGWCRLRTLPLIVLLGALTWAAYLAVGYLAGHGGRLVSEFGAITRILQEGLGDRLQGSPGHEQIVRLRLVDTVLLWLLAAGGLARLLRHRQPPAWGLAAASLAPFPLLLLQSYGGETLLRVSLFAMPFMTILAAYAVAGAGQLQPSWAVLATIVLVGSVFITAFPFARYGNERMDWFSPREVAAVRALYALAPKGSLLVSVTNNLPWRDIKYADQEYKTLTADARKLRSRHPPIATGPVLGESESADLGGHDPALLVDQVTSRMMTRDGRAAYLIITRSQAADLDLFGPWPPGSANHLVTALRAAPRFEVVIDNEDAVVFRLRRESVTSWPPTAR